MVRYSIKDVLKVKCPTCGAHAHENCLSVHGERQNLPFLHYERHLRFRKLIGINKKGKYVGGYTFNK